MDVTLTAGVTLIDFLNKSLDTLKLIQKDEPNSMEMQLHLATLTQQLSLTMVEASQLNGILAQKNEEIRALKAKLDERKSVQYDNATEMYWANGDESPFCTKCYEGNSKLIHLKFIAARPARHGDIYVPGSSAHYFCTTCKSSYNKIRT
ncbi:hypothetical protein V9789_004440 [Vibrio vulnificus]|uniref:Uncharacterized protein n=1 Tax=Vibrio parahaemolyticus TaxID=670 RepID=A0AAW8Q8L9_VIBPH|nr:hypothetical protein [Vibrio parahaemolyticus]EHK9050683.1 hypothetical protein [Vibrio vulnificus]EHK9055042.1 hypothetical protein [Vibrio vulnificus]EKA6052557.1 hypothetical protein [Vibrio vulnificus]ELB7646309.1 hypothetical protein [Vibrio vulnificus]ELP4436266.1 hypothetical protein [Vibrio vulnificus]